MDDPQITGSVVSTAPAPDASRRRAWPRARWFLAGGAAVLLCCTCAVVATAMALKGTLEIAQSRAPITSVLRSYMRAMQGKDAEEAYALFSSMARSSIRISDVENAFSGNNFVLYEGFQDLAVDSLEFNTNLSNEPGVPQGLVARVAGKVWYEHGFVGSFTADLQKENGQWYLLNVTVIVPPSKFQ